MFRKIKAEKTEAGRTRIVKHLLSFNDTVADDYISEDWEIESVVEWLRTNGWFVCVDSDSPTIVCGYKDPVFCALEGVDKEPFDMENMMVSDVKMTRVDIYARPDNSIIVYFYEDGWRAGSRKSCSMRFDMSLEEAISRMKSAPGRWDIVTWKKGARAFYGKRMPIRTREDILKARSSQRKAAEIASAGGQLHAVDFAYEW